MIEIPVIDDVLVVPRELAGVGVNGQRAVVVEVLHVVAGEDELGRRNRHRRADVDQVQLRVVARHHPGADVPALVHRHVAPRFVARLAGSGNRVKAPQLLAGLGVVRRDDARVAAGVGLALAAGDHLAVGDDRPAAGRGALLGIENRGFPRQLAGLRIERVDEVVRARVDDPDCPTSRWCGWSCRPHALGQLALVFPEHVAGFRVDRHDVVAGIRHVHHAVVDERRPFLVAAARGRGPRPSAVAATLLRLIWFSGLKPQPSGVRRHISQSPGSGFCSIASVTGTNLRARSWARPATPHAERQHDQQEDRGESLHDSSFETRRASPPWAKR